MKTLKSSLEKFVVAKIAFFKEEEENWRTLLLNRKTGTQNVKPRLLLPRAKLFVWILRTTVVTSPDGQLCQTANLLIETGPLKISSVEFGFPKTIHDRPFFGEFCARKWPKGGEYSNKLVNSLQKS